MIGPARTSSWRQVQPSTVAAVGLLLALGYCVLIGGTVIGELSPTLWALSAGIGGTCLVAYAVLGPKRADAIDRFVLVALLLFLGAATLSSTPRQSFDAGLLVLVYAAVLFIARGLLASPRIRLQLLRTLMVLSTILTLLIAARWIPQYVEWWTLTGRTVIPPLNFEYAAVPWGHRYDLMIAMLLLYPAWWIGGSSALRRALGTVLGALILVMLVMTGSRGLWLAVGIASLVLVTPHAVRAWRSWHPFRIGVLIGGPLIIALLALSGTLSLLLARATNLETVSWRSEMWGPLVDVWTANPLAGYGPGSLPWILQLTGYFDSNGWAPRTPDSVPVQLLAETGLLGVSAVAVLLVGLVPALLRGSSAGARWALTIFVLFSILSSPTEFPFIMAIVLAWVAFAVPRSNHSSDAGRPPSPTMRYASGIAIGVIAVAYLATLIAATTYDRARSLIDEHRLTEARQALDQAVSLDPGLAIYARQRGTVAYLQGDAPSAIRDLRRTTELNPSDDLAWRTLGLAYELAGEADASRTALARAVELQRSDVTNLLLDARWQSLAGRATDASEVLSEVVQSTPAIIAAPGWTDLLPPGVETSDIVAMAADRWGRVPEGVPVPVDQGLWLGVLADRDDLVERVLGQDGTNRPMAEATVALLRCEAADDRLAEVDDSALRSLDYWTLRLWADASAGRSTDNVWRVQAIMRGDFDTLSGAVGILNPLDENGATSADVWGYRRYPIHWTDSGVALPDPAAGLRYWLTQPREAVRDADMERQLPGCS